MRFWLAITAAACVGGTKADSGTTSGTTATTGDSVGCDILPDKTCGHGAHSGDTGCPDGYDCSGPSSYQCYQGNCDLPSCLPPDAPIDTPDGPRAVSTLAPGDLVLTLSAAGDVVVAPVVKVGSRAAPPGHQVVDLVLSDGREVLGSPGHPTADGRRLGELRAGDVLDGAMVESAERVPFAAARTWDLRPAGASGAYWANDVLLGSTLRAP